MDSKPDELTPRNIEREFLELTQRYGAIADLGLSALAEASRTELFNNAVSVVREALDADFSKILEIQPQGTLLVTAGEGWGDGVVGELEVPADGDSQASYALRLREPVIVENLDNEQRFVPDPIFRKHGVISGVNVVIEGAQRPYGVLEVDHGSPRSWSDESVSFLQLVANVLGSAIDRELREQEREQFVASVSHEIRNPLTSVLGFTRRIARVLQPGATVTDAAYEEIEILVEQVGRLGRAVDMVFQLARVERPASLTPEPLNLSALLHEIVRDLEALYPDVHFEEEYEDEDLEVPADEIAARAAFRNVTENAAKYSTGRDPAEVRVALRRQDDQVVVAVSDTCGGLSGEEIARMFQQNYRGEGRSGAPGIGIGLYLTMRVCTAFGWRVDVTNHPGDGCTFVIVIGGEGALPATTG